MDIETASPLSYGQTVSGHHPILNSAPCMHELHPPLAKAAPTQPARQPPCLSDKGCCTASLFAPHLERTLHTAGLRCVEADRESAQLPRCQEGGSWRVSSWLGGVGACKSRTSVHEPHRKQDGGAHSLTLNPNPLPLLDKPARFLGPYVRGAGGCRQGLPA